MDLQEQQALKKLVEEATEKGTEASLLKLGLNVNDPISMQKDLAFLRNQREANEQLGRNIRRVLITVFLMSSLTWLGQAIWQAITNK